MEMGVIPIVNENDTLAVAEIKFGDNDTLSAITAAMIHADMLFLMTDVDCLYDKNPRTHPDARPIEIVDDICSLEADGKSCAPPRPPKARGPGSHDGQCQRPALPSAPAAWAPRLSPLGWACSLASPR